MHLNRVLLFRTSSHLFSPCGFGCIFFKIDFLLLEEMNANLCPIVGERFLGNITMEALLCGDVAFC